MKVCATPGCAKTFAVSPRAPHRRFCNKNCQHRWARLQRHVPRNPTPVKLDFELSALNVETTLRYLACEHSPSGEYVLRWYDGEFRHLPVCAGCSVPLPGRPWLRRYPEVAA